MSDLQKKYDVFVADESVPDDVRALVQSRLGPPPPKWVPGEEELERDRLEKEAATSPS